MNRYSRHIILNEIGQIGQDKILNSKVLVVGAGGLGCPALQYLAAAGVGTIGIIDHDVVDVSNLQRQILFGTASIGINKAIAAKAHLENLNDTIEIKAFPYKLDVHNAIELFSQFDIIVDGTDDIPTRYLISDAAILTNKAVVYGAIYKFEGQVSVFNYNDGPSYRCLFPNTPKSDSIASCSEVGVLGVLPGIIGTMQANEVLKIILEMEGILSGKILCYDSRSTNTYTLTLFPSEKEITRIKKQKQLEVIQIDRDCHAIPSIEIVHALAMGNTQFIDVRQPHELPKVQLPNLKNIPLEILTEQLDDIERTRTTIVFCQSGIRSAKAVQILNSNGFTDCFNLEAGAVSIVNHLNLKTT